MAYSNPDDQKAAARRHYEKNKAIMIARAAEHKKAHRAKVRAHILEYLNLHPCVDCGENDPVVLEFDHREDKLFNVADAAALGKTIIKLEAEIAKCDVRCANCHRRKTHQRRCSDD